MGPGEGPNDVSFVTRRSRTFAASVFSTIVCAMSPPGPVTRCRRGRRRRLNTGPAVRVRGGGELSPVASRDCCRCPQFSLSPVTSASPLHASSCSKAASGATLSPRASRAKRSPAPPYAILMTLHKAVAELLTACAHVQDRVVHLSIGPLDQVAPFRRAIQQLEISAAAAKKALDNEKKNAR